MGNFPRLIGHFKQYPASLLLIFVYFFIFLNTASFQGWVHPEEFPIKAYILENGNSVQWEDAARGLNFRRFEFASRPSRPLSSYFDLLDTKFRSWVWQFLPPVPNLSLTWIFSIFLAPYFLFRLLRRWQLDPNVCFAAVAFYLATPGVLSGVFMIFRPAKPLVNAGFIICLYLASTVSQGIREHRPTVRAYAVLLAAVFVTLFLDESAVIVIPAIFLIFPEILNRRRYLTAWASLAGLFLSFQLYFIPEALAWAGYQKLSVMKYFIWQGVGNFSARIAQFWYTFPINTQLMLKESFGLLDIHTGTPLLIMILQAGILMWLLALIVLFARNRVGLYQKQKRILSNQALGWTLALACAFALHNGLLDLTNYIWGPFYYGSFCSVLLTMLWARILQTVKLETIFLTIGSLVMLAGMLVSFLGTNAAYKKFHFYPYSPMGMTSVYLGQTNRFEAAGENLINTDELRAAAEDYWFRRHQKGHELPDHRLPKELFWLRIEMNPKGYRPCGGHSEALCFAVGSGQ